MGRNSLNMGRLQQLTYGHYGFQVMPFGLTNAPCRILDLHESGLAGYLSEDFIEGFLKIATRTKLTQRRSSSSGSAQKQGAVFQLLKQKLCSAPILALPKGSEDFIAYCDASKKGLGAVLMQKEKCSLSRFGGISVRNLGTVFTDLKTLSQHILDQKKLNMRQHRWLELFSDYDFDIRYHPGKANVVADALSRKEREPPLRVRALVVTISLDLPNKSLNAQTEAGTWEHQNEDVEVGYHVMSDLRDGEHGTESKNQNTLYIQNALGTSLDMSTAYHPQTDGQSERTIQTLEDMLHACAIDFGKGWVNHFPLVEFSYNNSYTASSRVHQFEAL
ncbi:putative reverse transcriptase domain-containing protein [Tanacetum coccineum]